MAKKIIQVRAKKGFITITGTSKQKIEKQLGKSFKKFENEFKNTLENQLKLEGKRIVRYLRDWYITDEYRTSPEPANGYLYRATGKLRDSLKSRVFIEKGLKTYKLTIKSEASGELKKYVDMHINPKIKQTVIKPTARRYLAVPTKNIIQNHRMSSGKIPEPSETGLKFKFIKASWIRRYASGKNPAEAYLMFARRSGKRNQIRPQDFAYTLHKSVTVPRKVNLADKTSEAVKSVGTAKNLANLRAKLRKQLVRKFKKG